MVRYFITSDICNEMLMFYHYNGFKVRLSIFLVSLGTLLVHEWNDQKVCMASIIKKAMPQRAESELRPVFLTSDSFFCKRARLTVQRVSKIDFYLSRDEKLI